jgi:hypothetical protein
MSTRSLKTKIGGAAGLIAGSAGLALAAGLGPAPSLLSTASAGGSGDTTTSTTDDTTDDTTGTTVGGTSTSAPVTATRVVQAGPAGSLEVAEMAGRLELVTTSPAAGWSVEVEHAAGREVEVDFRRADKRVQVNVELEDGTVRERVRYRDDATGTRVEAEDGTVVRAEGDGRDGSGGHGTDDSSGDDSDDRGGRDDRGHDDHDGSGGHGTDDRPGDDHGHHG